MGRARRRADRIREEIDIALVLADYGYPVHPGGGSEEQFPCDLHGDGHDNKPSGRMYPDSNSWYCFACDRSRDSIETAREKEGLTFWDAVKALEARYKLPPLPWEDEDQEEYDANRKPKAEDEVAAALDHSRTFADVQKRLRTLLDNVTHDRDLAMKVTLSRWEAFDKVCYLVDKEFLPEDKGREALNKIHAKVMEDLTGKHVDG